MPGGIAAANGSPTVMRGRADDGPGRFNRPRRRLRASMVQLLFAVAGLGLGLLLPRIAAEELLAGNVPEIWRHSAEGDPA